MFYDGLISAEVKPFFLSKAKSRPPGVQTVS
jgi:hypothetical protein